jgi:hypothetical protein
LTPLSLQKQRYQLPPLLHKCSGNVMVEHPTLDLVDVRIGALPNFPFKPKVHLNYAEPVLPIKDGLPKLRDFPAATGGSGETMPE